VHGSIGVPTVLASSARFSQLLCGGALAEQQLAKPECQPLLADPASPDEEHARRQATGVPGGGEAFA